MGSNHLIEQVYVLNPVNKVSIVESVPLDVNIISGTISVGTISTVNVGGISIISSVPIDVNILNTCISVCNPVSEISVINQPSVTVLNPVSQISIINIPSVSIINTCISVCNPVSQISIINIPSVSVVIPNAAGSPPFVNNFKLLDFRFLGQDNKLIWYESTGGAGASAFSTTTNELSMNVTTASGDSVIRQTQRIMGQSLAPMIWLCGCTLGAKKTNVRQRVGAFDSSDGYFFEQDGTNLKIVTRSSVSGVVTDTTVIQSSWNVDKFDGTGVSGITLTSADYNVYFVVENYDYIEFGIIMNGNIYYCHKINAPNIAVNTGFAIRNQPIRIEITNTAAAGSGTSLLVSNCSVFSSGGTTPFSIIRAVDLGITGKTVPATLTPLISLRLKSTNVKNKLLVSSFNLILSASQSVYITLIFNGTLTGAAFATTPGTNTISEYDSAATAISGGDVIFSSYSSGSGQGNGNAPSPIIDISSLLQISSNIAGTSDVITLAAQKTGGTSPTAYPALIFREFV